MDGFGIVEGRGPNMQLASGKPFFPLDPRPDEIEIDDIAIALSRICRFGGHTTTFYSVAEHSILVSLLVPDEHRLTALLHDATEAYIGDMIRPLKSQIPQFSEIENNLWGAIAERFSLPVEMPSCVKEADVLSLAIEKRDVMAEPIGVDWGTLPSAPNISTSWSLRAGSAKEFLLHFYKYGGK